MDFTVIAFRWMLYVLLGLAFGLPCFGIYASGDGGVSNGPLFPKRAISMIAIVATVASLAAFSVQVAAMAGTSWPSLDQQTTLTILNQSALGTALKFRLGALLVLLACSRWRGSPSQVVRWLAVLSGGTALATLAWSGHGAADDGSAGWIHLAADVTHLLAAGVWLGAIAAFVVGLGQRDWDRSPSRRLWWQHALARFGTIGAVTVALLVATGIVNSYFLIRVQDLAPQALGIYLYLLAAKLVAFAGMLLLAAVHKFRLVPSLENAIGEDRASGAWARLTRSLMLEAALAIAVIGLVAWLGTLPPPSSL